MIMKRREEERRMADVVRIAVPMMLKCFCPLIRFAENIFGKKVNWEYDGYTKELRIAFPVDHNRYHIIAVKISERVWVLPESYVRKYFRKLERHVYRKLHERKLAEAFTYCLIAKATYPVTRKYPRRVVNIFYCLFNTRISDVKKIVNMIRKLIASLYDRKAQQLRASVEEKNIEPYGWVDRLIKFYEAVRDILLTEDYMYRLLYSRYVNL